MGKLAGKVAIVTGASKGIGAAMDHGRDHQSVRRIELEPRQFLRDRSISMN